MFRQGNTYGKGRPLGAKNLLPNRQIAVELIDIIIQDIQSNYEQLDMEHKIRILNTFRHLFITNENVPFEIPNNEIRVTIHKPLGQ
jgi:hypothetical protein